MKEIKLSERNGSPNKGKYVAIVDDEDFDYLNQFRWTVEVHKKTCYARRLIRSEYSVKYIAMHTLLLNPNYGEMVDHINHNGLDNRRCNLRICTRGQNGMNKQSHGKIKYLGVSVHNNNGNFNKFRSDICLNRKKYYLGTFNCEIEAAKAYDNKARELFGEFANLNFK